jgi:hypothetical protein
MQQAAAAAVHGGTAAVHGCPVVKPKLSLDGVAMTGTFEFCDTGHAFLLSWLWNATQSMCFGTVCTAISDGTAVPFPTDELFVLVAPTMWLSSLAHNIIIIIIIIMLQGPLQTWSFGPDRQSACNMTV